MSVKATLDRDSELVQYEVVPGQYKVRNVNAVDESFFPAEGGTVMEHYSNAGGLKRMVKNVRARKNLKAKAKASFKTNKGKAALTSAQAQKEAAKGLSKPDSTTVINKTSGGGKKATKLSTGAKIGIGVGVAVALGIIAFVIIRKHKKK